MSFLEKISLFPVKMLVTMIKILGPVLLGLFALVFLISYPLFVGCFGAGLLLAPLIWKKIGVVPFEAADIITAFTQQQTLLQRRKEDNEVMLSVTKEKLAREEQKLQKKIQRLANDTEALEQRYQEILVRRPDKIIYEAHEPEAPSLIQWIKQRFSPGR